MASPYKMGPPRVPTKQALQPHRPTARPPRPPAAPLMENDFAAREIQRVYRGSRQRRLTPHLRQSSTDINGWSPSAVFQEVLRQQTRTDSKLLNDALIHRRERQATNKRRWGLAVHAVTTRRSTLKDVVDAVATASAAQAARFAASEVPPPASPLVGAVTEGQFVNFVRLSGLCPPGYAHSHLHLLFMKHAVVRKEEAQRVAAMRLFHWYADSTSSVPQSSILRFIRLLEPHLWPTAVAEAASEVSPRVGNLTWKVLWPWYDNRRRRPFGGAAADASRPTTASSVSSASAAFITQSAPATVQPDSRRRYGRVSTIAAGVVRPKAAPALEVGDAAARFGSVDDGRDTPFPGDGLPPATEAEGAVSGLTLAGFQAALLELSGAKFPRGSTCACRACQSYSSMPAADWPPFTAQESECHNTSSLRRAMQDYVAGFMAAVTRTGINGVTSPASSLLFDAKIRAMFREYDGALQRLFTYYASKGWLRTAAQQLEWEDVRHGQHGVRYLDFVRFAGEFYVFPAMVSNDYDDKFALLRMVLSAKQGNVVGGDHRCHFPPGQTCGRCPLCGWTAVSLSDAEETAFRDAFEQWVQASDESVDGMMAQSEVPQFLQSAGHLPQREVLKVLWNAVVAAASDPTKPSTAPASSFSADEVLVGVNTVRQLTHTATATLSYFEFTVALGLLAQHVLPDGGSPVARLRYFLETKVNPVFTTKFGQPMHHYTVSQAFTSVFEDIDLPEVEERLEAILKRVFDLYCRYGLRPSLRAAHRRHLVEGQFLLYVKDSRCFKRVSTVVVSKVFAKCAVDGDGRLDFAGFMEAHDELFFLEWRVTPGNEAKRVVEFRRPVAMDSPITPLASAKRSALFRLEMMYDVYKLPVRHDNGKKALMQPPEHVAEDVEHVDDVLRRPPSPVHGLVDTVTGERLALGHVISGGDQRTGRWGKVRRLSVVLQAMADMQNPTLVGSTPSPERNAVFQSITDRPPSQQGVLDQGAAPEDRSKGFELPKDRPQSAPKSPTTISDLVGKLSADLPTVEVPQFSSQFRPAVGPYQSPPARLQRRSRGRRTSGGGRRPSMGLGLPPTQEQATTFSQAPANLHSDDFTTVEKLVVSAVANVADGGSPTMYDPVFSQEAASVLPSGSRAPPSTTVSSSPRPVAARPATSPTPTSPPGRRISLLAESQVGAAAPASLVAGPTRPNKRRNSAISMRPLALEKLAGLGKENLGGAMSARKPSRPTGHPRPRRALTARHVVAEQAAQSRLSVTKKTMRVCAQIVLNSKLIFRKPEEQKEILDDMAAAALEKKVKQLRHHVREAKLNRNAGGYGLALMDWQKGLAMAQGLKDVVQQVAILQQLTVCCLRMDKLKDALQHAEEGLALTFGYPAATPVDKARMLGVLGACFDASGDHKRAADAHRRRAVMFHIADVDAEEARALLDLGKTLIAMCKWNAGATAVHKALHLTEDGLDRVVGEGLLGDCFMHLGYVKDAVVAFEAQVAGMGDPHHIQTPPTRRKRVSPSRSPVKRTPTMSPVREAPRVASRPRARTATPADIRGSISTSTPPQFLDTPAPDTPSASSADNSSDGGEPRLKPLITASFTAHAALFGIRETPHLAALVRLGDGYSASRRYKDAMRAYDDGRLAARREANRFVEAEAGVGVALARLLSTAPERARTSCFTVIRERLAAGDLAVRGMTPEMVLAFDWSPVLGSGSASIPQVQDDADAYNMARSSAEAQARRVLWLAGHWEEESLKAYSYRLLATTEAELGRDDEAVDAYTKAVDLAKASVDPALRCECLLQLALLHLRRSDAHHAAQVAFQCLLTAWRLAMLHYVGMAHRVLGVTLTAAGYHGATLAVGHLLQAMRIARELQDRIAEAEAAADLGDTYLLLGSPWFRRLGHNPTPEAPLAAPARPTRSPRSRRQASRQRLQVVQRGKSALETLRYPIPEATPVLGAEPRGPPSFSERVSFAQRNLIMRSADMLQLALPGFTSAGNMRMCHRLFATLGRCYVLLEEERLALACWTRAAVVAEALGDGYGHTEALLQLGVTQSRLACYKDAIASFNKAKLAAVDMRCRPMVDRASSHLADMYTAFHRHLDGGEDADL